MKKFGSHQQTFRLWTRFQNFSLADPSRNSGQETTYVAIRWFMNDCIQKRYKEIPVKPKPTAWKSNHIIKITHNIKWSSYIVKKYNDFNVKS